MKLNRIAWSARVGRILVVASLLACCLVGCAGKGAVGTVEGKVTIEGQPVPAGTVVMFADGPEPFSAIIGSDGTFKTAAPVKVGSYSVAVQQVTEDTMSPMERKKADAAGTLKIEQSIIPEKYMNTATSGVKFEIKDGGPNTFDLDMTKQKAGAAPGGGSGKGGKSG